MTDTNTPTPDGAGNPYTDNPYTETIPAVPAASQEQVDAHAGALDAHAEQIAQHDGWLAELERNIGARLDRIEARVGVRTATDGPPTVASVAKNDDGLEGGHAGPGTGDGPAGG